jgi:hypothetical protein
MFTSQATRAVASVIMFPILLVCKVLMVSVRILGALGRFILGVGESCIALLKEIPGM